MNRIKSLQWANIRYVLHGILIGTIAGTVVSAFRMIISILLDYMPRIYGYLKENTLFVSIWFFVLISIAILVMVLMRDEEHIKGNGVAELKGQLQGSLRLNWFSILWRKFLSSALVLGLGIPLGQEGPSIQIGGVVGQGINHFMKGSRSQESIFISSGAAAGLAAAFNAPLSAFVLVLEEIHHRFSNILILSVFSASVTASFVAYNIFGSEPAIGLGATIAFPIEYYISLIGLGALLAVGGWLFQRGVFRYTPKFLSYLPIPDYLHGFIPFVLVLFIGIFWTDMLGGGTDVIMMIASESASTKLLLAIFVFRFITFQISFGTKIPGGSLVPSLAFGAILGALYGNQIIGLTGIENQFVRNFVIYGMGGFFTATTKAPLTAIVLITELTGSIGQLMPISIVCLSAYVISDLLKMEPTDDITLRNKTNQIPTIYEGEIILMDITIEFNGELDGELIKDLILPFDTRIIKVSRYGKEFLPDGNTRILPGDQVQLATDSGFASKVADYFERANNSSQKKKM